MPAVSSILSGAVEKLLFKPVRIFTGQARSIQSVQRGLK